MHVTLHSGSKERGIPENVEDVLAGRHQHRLALTNVDTVDVGLAPKAEYDDEGIALKIDLCSYLYNDTMNGEAVSYTHLRAHET